MGLPSGLSALTSLRELHAANNKLQQLPRVMEPLQKLEVLQVGRSRRQLGGG
jgi:Leucine-rich repeat (LRR) protein